MLWRRVLNQQPRESWIRHLAWDSSPQHGRDFELGLINSVRRRDLVFLLQSMHQMRQMWLARPWEETQAAMRDCKDKEEALMDKCAS
eukprot:5923961-Karenia_brevis.AAC.1